jgi:hypothetical protein
MFNFIDLEEKDNNDKLFSKYLSLGIIQNNIVERYGPNHPDLIDIARERCRLSVVIKNFGSRLKSHLGH